MPQNITDADLFTDPVQVPADSDPANLQYLLTAFQALSNRTRWAFERITSMFGVSTIGDSDWEHTYPDNPIRVTYHPLTGYNMSAADDHGWSGEVFSTSPTQGYRKTTRVDGARWVIPLSEIFRSGANITQIRVMMQPGAARATAGDRARVYWYQQEHSYAGPTRTFQGPFATTTSDATANLQLITLSGLDITIDNTLQTLYFLVIEGGVDSGTNEDHWESMEVTWSDLGLRNF